MTRRILDWIKWHGRMRRRTFLWRAIAVGAVFVVLYVFMERTTGRFSTLLLYPALFAILLSLGVRRLHDQAKRSGWLLAVLIPVLGPLLVLFLLLLRRGTAGENQYGADPRTRGRDYLQVAAFERA
ncbi:MAG TPA: DUF805 domain-containing protein [Lysobacter sp.]|jgi:uncharacterized membrane protein YhaH (DUF805 family)|nr:DUF805 domain-containing protein [Lysobacter sp.]